jgi:hypothetical protein
MTALWEACNTSGWICRKHEKIEKVTGSVRRFAQDDDFVEVLKKNIPNKLAAYGSKRGITF